MLLCSGSTFWSFAFQLSSILLVGTLIGVFTKSLLRIFKNNKTNSYEKVDLLIIIIAYFHTIFIFISFLINNYLFIALILSILKFSINSIISCILLVIILWKHSSVTFLIMNYFMITILIFDILFFLVGVFHYGPFDIIQVTGLEMLLMIIGVIFDSVVIFCSIYFQRKEDDNLINDNDQFFINSLFKKYSDNIKKMLKNYLIIILFLLVSYILDLIFTYMIALNNSKASDEVFDENQKNSTVTENDYKSDCNYDFNFGINFSFSNYFFCFIGFLFKDVFPNFYIYLGLIFLRSSSYSRSSSFIEAL